MTDAPETIVLQPCFVEGWALPDRVKYETSIAIQYTRTDISQARVAQLEAALSDIAQMHGDNPSLAMADMPDGDYQRYVLSHARRIARAALKAKP
jgi:hypothetical protein